MTQATSDPLALGRRTGLPDALRVLLEDYPRAGWENDPGYEGLLRFWLDRHMMFRRLLGTMKSKTEALLDAKMDPMSYGGRMSRYGGMFVNELHGHHQIEDAHYFPAMAAQDKRIEAGFAILDKDHHAIDGHLNAFITQANDALGALQDDKRRLTAAGGFHAGLSDLEGILDRHLIDEEELVVPLVLKYGAGFLG